MFVVPACPNGTPAAMTTLSPTLAKPSSSAVLHARSVIVLMSVVSFVSTECTPQTSARRRAVEIFGVRLRIGASGRSRDARMLKTNRSACR